MGWTQWAGGWSGSRATACHPWSYVPAESCKGLQSDPPTGSLPPLFLPNLQLSTCSRGWLLEKLPRLGRVLRETEPTGRVDRDINREIEIKKEIYFKEMPHMIMVITKSKICRAGQPTGNSGWYRLESRFHRTAEWKPREDSGLQSREGEDSFFRTLHLCPSLSWLHEAHPHYKE